MFEFFKKIATGIGFKLIDNFSDKVTEWIKGVFENCKEVDDGYYAQNASSGDYAQNASSGDYAKNASSGDCAQNASSGDCAQNASSGNCVQNASSGYYAKNASSGYYAKNVISGKNSICFDCGYKGMIKAVKGTWISLAEYGKNEKGIAIPIYAKSAQIGNKEFKDHNGKTLKSNTYYMLWKKEFYPVDNYDDIWTINLSEHKRDNIKIIKAVDIDDIYSSDEAKPIYIAKEGRLTAHGYTIREAVEDLTLKKLDKVNTDEIVAKIKETGKVTRSQYRAITGACSFGTNKFCEEHSIQDLEEIELTELRKILVSDYGAEKFWKLIDKGEE